MWFPFLGVFCDLRAMVDVSLCHVLPPQKWMCFRYNPPPLALCPSLRQVKVQHSLVGLTFCCHSLISSVSLVLFPPVHFSVWRKVFGGKAIKVTGTSSHICVSALVCFAQKPLGWATRKVAGTLLKHFWSKQQLYQKLHHTMFLQMTQI